MVSFFVYDITFMVIFTLAVAIFLLRHKKVVDREGIMFMYRTKVGMKAINKIGDKYRKFLDKMKYVIIPTGFVLMTSMIYMLIQTVITYITNPRITDVIKAPPIAPLIPYFPQIFNMESFFPPFYFTYFIVALAIVAIVHEFSHGIFMRAFKTKIKSTGIVFLGPILGAFVEEDKNQFVKKKSSEQMTILGAGVFANLIFAIIFYLLYLVFFITSFAPAGYAFNSYGMALVPAENITGFSNMTNGLLQVNTASGNYYLDQNLAIQLTENKTDFVISYVETPAVLAQMKGAIIQANDVKIYNQDTLQKFMKDTEPGDVVTFTTELENETQLEYKIKLATHPDNSSIGYIGIGSSIANPKSLVQKILYKFTSFKDPTTYYKPTWDGQFVYFIYHLLWWVMLINLLVAMFNMLPWGILDGGRFFYLGMLAIFKKKKTAKVISKITARLIALAIVTMMIFWLIGIL